MVNVNILEFFILLTRLAFYTMADNPEAPQYFSNFAEGSIELVTEGEEITASFSIDGTGKVLTISGPDGSDPIEFVNIDNGLYKFPTEDIMIDMASMYMVVPFEDMKNNPAGSFSIVNSEGTNWDISWDWTEGTLTVQSPEILGRTVFQK